MGPKSGEAGKVAILAAADGYGLASAAARPPFAVVPGEVPSWGDETSDAEGESRGVNLNDAAREKDDDLDTEAGPGCSGLSRSWFAAVAVAVGVDPAGLGTSLTGSAGMVSGAAGARAAAAAAPASESRAPPPPPPLQSVPRCPSISFLDRRAVDD